MAEYILLIDSNYEEAEGFVRGLEEATASPWEVELYPNNKTYGLRRYLKFSRWRSMWSPTRPGIPARPCSAGSSSTASPSRFSAGCSTSKSGSGSSS